MKDTKYYEKYPERFEERYDEYYWEWMEELLMIDRLEKAWDELYEAEFRWLEEGRLEDLDVSERKRIARAGSGLATPLERGMGNISFSSLFHFRAVE